MIVPLIRFESLAEAARKILVLSAGPSLGLLHSFPGLAFAAAPDFRTKVPYLWLWCASWLAAGFYWIRQKIVTIECPGHDPVSNHG